MERDHYSIAYVTPGADHSVSTDSSYDLESAKKKLAKWQAQCPQWTWRLVKVAHTLVSQIDGL